MKFTFFGNLTAYDLLFSGSHSGFEGNNYFYFMRSFIIAFLFLDILKSTHNRVAVKGFLNLNKGYYTKGTIYVGVRVRTLI